MKFRERLLRSIVCLRYVAGSAIWPNLLTSLVWLVTKLAQHPRIPLRWGLILLYRGCEGTDIGRYMDGTFPDHEDRLQYTFNHIWINDVPVFAIKSLGKRRQVLDQGDIRIIQWSGGKRQVKTVRGMSAELHVMRGTSNLAYALSHKTVAFTNSRVRLVDVWKVSQLMRQLDPGPTVSPR